MPRTLEALDEALECLEKAMDKAEGNLTERLKTIDLTAFVTKQDFQVTFSAIAEDIRYLRESKATIEGKASQQSVLYLSIVTAVALIMSAIGLVMRFLKL